MFYLFTYKRRRVVRILAGVFFFRFRKNEYLRCVTEEYGMISEIRMEKGGLRT